MKASPAPVESTASAGTDGTWAVTVPDSAIRGTAGTQCHDGERDMAAQLRGGVRRVRQAGQQAGLVGVGNEDVRAGESRQHPVHAQHGDEARRCRVDAHRDAERPRRLQGEQGQSAAGVGEEQIAGQMQMTDPAEQRRRPVGGGQAQHRAAVGEEGPLGALVDEGDDRGRRGLGVRDEERPYAGGPQPRVVPAGLLLADPRQQPYVPAAPTRRPAGDVGSRTARQDTDRGRRVRPLGERRPMPGHHVGDHISDDEQGIGSRGPWHRHSAAAIRAASRTFPRTAATFASSEAPSVRRIR